MNGKWRQPVRGIDGLEKVKTDLLVIGTGLAGMWAAIMAREKGVRDVVMVDKGSIADSSQSKMCAGATIYCERRDNADKWLAELVHMQSLLSRQDMLSDMLSESERILKRLKSWGLWYKRMPWGSTRLPVGGTRRLKMRAMVRYKNLSGGAALVGPMKERILGGEYRLYSKVMITDLLMRDDRVAGAIGIHRLSGKIIVFESRAIVLATADCSFRNTGCIGQATGDGFRLAYNAGARLTNMEFLGSNTGSPDLSFEAFADIAAVYGCRFRNAKGEVFMKNYSPLGDRAEPFRIAQAMADEADKGNGPPFHFDMRGRLWRMILSRVYMKNMSGYMRQIFTAVERRGFEIRQVPQVWAPLIRTIRGGVRTELNGSCDVSGLFPAGVAQSMDPIGVNGFSTLRAMWSGRRAGETAARFLNDADGIEPRRSEVRDLCSKALLPMTKSSGYKADSILEELQNLIFPYRTSLKKSSPALECALKGFQDLRENVLPEMSADNSHDLVKVHEVAGMIVTGELYLSASLTRKETRGDHYRADYPETDNRQWLKWINLEKGSNGNPAISYEDVPLDDYQVKS